MISENSMMSMPINDVNTVKIPENIPDFELEDYDLMDDKDREKYINDLERCVRSSFEYRQMIQYLRQQLIVLGLLRIQLIYKRNMVIMK